MSESVMRSHGLLAGLRFRERVHEGHQTFTVGSGEVDLESMGEAAFQASLPAGTTVVQIRAASSQLARRVYQHSIGAADDAHQLPLGEHSAASNASPLGNVLHTLNRFLGHLRYKALLCGRLEWIEASEG